MLLELGVPYSEGATRAYLDRRRNDNDGGEGEGEGDKGWGYCSAGAARALAEVGFSLFIFFYFIEGVWDWMCVYLQVGRCWFGERNETWACPPWVG